jgi:hypothetical protein
MDKQEVLRRVAEVNRLLVEGRRTIDRQRDIIVIGSGKLTQSATRI